MSENKLFEQLDYTNFNLRKDEYEDCKFVHCKFNSSDLSDITFNGCLFDNCDFSLANIKNTGFDKVKFLNCKLLGLHFEECNDFLLTVYFENCILKLSTFYKLKLKKTIFKNCNLQEADFSEAELIESTFDNCDLQRTVFYYTNLEKVDFYSSYNYSLDPESNRVKKARFSRSEAIRLLDKYDLKIED